MTRPRTISILGNSVPILIQPFRQNSQEMTYPEHLRDNGMIVINAAKQSTIASDLYLYLEDECIRYFPDYVIWNFGIVDCTYRARPRWLQNYFSMNAWNNSIIHRGYNGPMIRGIKFFTKKLWRQLVERPAFVLGLKNRWLSPKDFRFVLRDITKRIFSDTPAKKLLLIGIPPVADWVEKQAPGTQESIKQYNQIMVNLTNEYVNCVFIDPHTLSSSLPLLSPDGIHFTAEGHRLLAQIILTHLRGEREDYTGWQKINQYEKLFTFYENRYKRKASRSE